MPFRRPTVNVRKITAKQSKAYNHVRPNPGVRTIASINGRGSYRRNKSARVEMAGASPAEKRAKARRAVARAVGRASNSAGRVVSNKGSTNMRRNRRRLRRNRWKETKSGSRAVKFAPRHSAAAKKGWKSRRKVRKNSAKRRTGVKRRAVRSNTRRRVTRRRVARKNPRRRVTRRNPRRRVARRRVARKNPRRRVARRRVRSNRRRVHSNRRRRVARRNPRRRAARRRVRSNTRRRVARRTRRNTGVKHNRRRARRNGTRRGGKRLFRRNGLAGLALDWLKTGSFIAGGLVGHKLLTGLVKNLLNSKGSVVTASTSAEADAKAASGLGLLPASLAPYAGTISGGLVAAAGVWATIKYVKNAETRKLIAGGIVASFVHTLLVDLLKKNAGTANFATQISGLGSDATAARLSAMYGVGSSIMPMYATLGGRPTGEYFSSGVGEYFSSGVSGLGAVQPYEAQAGMGEYFSSGIGAYESNPDVYQAAAGFGAFETSNSNHLDPSSNLDRELSIAEAAAGVGSVGPMLQAAAGLGNAARVSTVPTSQTWIPGESDAPIWAGVRPVDESQMATAMVPAGILSSGGGQGVFG